MKPSDDEDSENPCSIPENPDNFNEKEQYEPPYTSIPVTIYQGPTDHNTETPEPFYRFEVVPSRHEPTGPTPRPSREGSPPKYL